MAMISARTMWGAVMGLAAATAAGCASTNVAGDGFPDPARAYPAGGTVIAKEAVRVPFEGMRKAQVQALLGAPHFNEGFFAVRRWDYVLQLGGSATDGAGLRCQLRLNFDAQAVVVSHAWSTTACAGAATVFNGRLAQPLGLR